MSERVEEDVTNTFVVKQDSPTTRDDLSCDCWGGGTAYAAHGSDVVLLAFTADVGWWRNAVAFTPSEARRLAAILTEQADRSDAITEGAEQ